MGFQARRVVILLQATGLEAHRTGCQIDGLGSPSCGLSDRRAWKPIVRGLTIKPETALARRREASKNADRDHHREAQQKGAHQKRCSGKVKWAGITDEVAEQDRVEK